MQHPPDPLAPPFRLTDPDGNTLTLDRHSTPDRDVILITTHTPGHPPTPPVVIPTQAMTILLSRLIPLPTTTPEDSP